MTVAKLADRVKETTTTTGTGTLTLLGRVGCAYRVVKKGPDLTAQPIVETVEKNGQHIRTTFSRRRLSERSERRKVG